MKYIVIAIAVLLVASFAYADQTGTTFWHSHSYADNVGAADRYSEYQEKRDNPLGLGLDVVLYEFEGDFQTYGLDNIEAQNKFDMVNKEYSGYIVVQCNAYRAIKNLMK